MCKTKYCHNPGSIYCQTCLCRRKRERNPMRYAFETLRANVYTLRANVYRRKGRAFFYLTFEEFKQYAIETDYMSKKGITKKSWSIDCKDQTMGYFIGNIRTVPATVNNKKRRLSLTYEFIPEVGRMVATLTNNWNDKIYSSEQDKQ